MVERLRVWFEAGGVLVGILSAVVIVGIVYSTSEYLRDGQDELHADMREREVAEVKWDADWMELDREQHAEQVASMSAIRSDVAVLSARDFAAIYAAGLRAGRDTCNAR